MNGVICSVSGSSILSDLSRFNEKVSAFFTWYFMSLWLCFQLNTRPHIWPTINIQFESFDCDGCNKISQFYDALAIKLIKLMAAARLPVIGSVSTDSVSSSSLHNELRTQKYHKRKLKCVKHKRLAVTSRNKYKLFMRTLKIPIRAYEMFGSTFQKFVFRVHSRRI